MGEVSAVFAPVYFVETSSICPSYGISALILKGLSGSSQFLPPALPWYCTCMRNRDQSGEGKMRKNPVPFGEKSSLLCDSGNLFLPPHFRTGIRARADPPSPGVPCFPETMSGTRRSTICPLIPTRRLTFRPSAPLEPSTRISARDCGRALRLGFPSISYQARSRRSPVSFEYSDESDPGPYPIPPGAAIEGGAQSDGDRHVLVVDQENCILYETFSSYPQPDGSWDAGSGAVFDLRSNGLRPSGWTSADAAGLPILPGLVRYEEVASGEIRHALRFTAPQTRRAFVWPALHYASNLTASNYPPMGQRFRLKANVDITGFSLEVQVILRALKKYGMILADNGSAWYLSGAPDPGWNNDHLVSELRMITGSDFEAVDGTALMISAESGQALQPLPPGSAFMDVPPTHWAFSHVMALHNSGITGGCSVNPPLFCPQNSITRGEMAVFLVTSLGSTPEVCTGRFSDVSISHPFCGFIEKLAADGMTGGCAASQFCPGASRHPGPDGRIY